jgi:hypothetical protein
MSENVGASTSGNPEGLHGLYRKNFTNRKNCDSHPSIYGGIVANVTFRVLSVWYNLLLLLKVTFCTLFVCVLYVGRCEVIR